MAQNQSAATDEAHRLAAELGSFRTQYGEPLPAIAENHRVLLVFLRHAGCTFCRRTLADLAAARAKLEFRGYRIVLIHMKDAAETERQLQRFGLTGVDRICDPDQRLYRAFGLKRGKLKQLLGPVAIWRGVKTALGDGHGIGYPRADPAQMPGVFLIEECNVVGRFRFRTVADRPEFERLCP
jgi:peroxiredoxin